jgi:hypothetical protein
MALVPISILGPDGAGAQSTGGLRSRIQAELFTFGDCDAALCLDLDNIHGNHFIPALSEGNAAVISFLTNAIGKATASVPLGATSGGATFTFEGGLPVQTSSSAGPVFGERSQTLGRGRFFFGTSVTGIELTSLNGVPLENLQLNFKHEDTDPVGVFGDSPFENDVIAMQLAMDVSVLVGTVAATYGLTDFIDVGVAVPLMRTSVQGRSEAQIMPFGKPAVHHFTGDDVDPVLRAAASMSGAATGLGDVVGRVKINLGQGTTMGAGLLAEVRVATGDEENLLGTGSTQVKAMGLYTAQLGSFSPHLNVGYAMRADELLTDALLVTAGFDNLMTDWATLAVGVVSETQVGESAFTLPGPIVWDTPYDRRMPSTNVPDRSEDILNATVGAKFTVRGGTVLVMNGMFPLRKVGLQPDFFWTLGLDLAF